jgi:hypothetical protein
MPNKNGRKRLVREGEDSQETAKGLEIPVPSKSEVMDVFKRATRKREQPSRSAKGKRRTSRDER